MSCLKKFRKVVGDSSVTTKANMRRTKENKVVYTGGIKKNLKTELFGRKRKVEDLFRDVKLRERG